MIAAECKFCGWYIELYVDTWEDAEGGAYCADSYDEETDQYTRLHHPSFDRWLLLRRKCEVLLCRIGLHKYEGYFTPSYVDVGPAPFVKTGPCRRCGKP